MSDANAVRKKHLSYYAAFILGGLVLIFLGLFFQDDAHTNIWLDTLKAIGQALIIGPAISLILDLPSMVNYFKKVTIKSLVSEEYLNALSRKKLIDLRKKCTAKIHLKNTTVAESGLIDLDEEICELLTKTYHDRYRQTVTCRKEGNYVIKKHQIEEHIINPLDRTEKYEENLLNYFDKAQGETVNDIFKVIKYTVKTDDKEEFDFKEGGLQLHEEPSDGTDMPYNTLMYIVDKDNKRPYFEFNKSLKIEKIYEVKVPASDRTFSKRVKIPVKSFRLDYHFPDAGVQLVASCFGTLGFPSEGDMKIIHEDEHISIESYTWMLPGNGVFVVAV